MNESLSFLGVDDVTSSWSVDDLLAILRRLTPEQEAELRQQLNLDSDSPIADWFPAAVTSSVMSYHDQLLQFSAYRTHKALSLFVPPLIILLGSAGNVFSFCILRRKPMLKFSTYFYLMILAIADTCVLYFGLVPFWFNNGIGYNVLAQSVWICRSFVVFNYSVSDFSVWLIIAVTAERYIAVCHPMKKDQLCSQSVARKTVVILFLFMLSLHLHFFVTLDIRQWSHRGSTVSSCESAHGFEVLVDSVWPWIDALLYSYLPFIIICVLNVCIIVQVMKSKQLRLGNGSDSCRSRRPTQEGSTRLTVMLLTISFTFLLTTLPQTIVQILAHFLDSRARHDLEVQANFQLAKTVALLLMYLNHSMNFVLYCATGQKFRKQLLWVLCDSRRGSPRGSDGSNGGNAVDVSRANYRSRMMKTLSGLTDTSNRNKTKTEELEMIRLTRQKS